jgi:hypothetical protein
MRFTRVFPVFSAAFAVFYALSVNFNLALFTYHPQLKTFAPLAEAPKSGPAMYWYGWIVTSALGALFVSALAMVLPRGLTARVWPGFAWLIPVGVIIFFVYLLKGYFLRSL